MIITNTYNYFTEKSKRKFEIFKISTLKKIEVGEKFFFISGENLQLILTSVYSIKKRPELESKANKELLQKSLEEMHEEFKKIASEKNIYGMVSLYFDVKLTYKNILESDLKTTNILLKIFELSDKLQTAELKDKIQYLEPIRKAYDELCAHYEKIISHIEDDMAIVQQEIFNISMLAKIKSRKPFKQNKLVILITQFFS